MPGFKNFKKPLALIVSFALVFTAFTQTTFAKSPSGIQTSNYVYNGTTYNIAKTQLPDGSVKVNVTSTNDSATVIINKDKTSETVVQTLSDPNKRGNKTTETLNLSNNLSKDSKSTNSTGSVVPMDYSGGGYVQPPYWGYYADYWTDSDYPSRENYYLEDTDCSSLPWEDWMYISSDEYNLCNNFYYQVGQIQSWQVGAIAAGGVGATSVVAGAIGGAPTLGLATVIGIVIGIGASITVAYQMYNAWCAAQAANKYFNEILVSYPSQW